MRKELPNLIYIVKPEDVPTQSSVSETYPNFTIPGSASNAASTANVVDLIKPTLTGTGLRFAALLAARTALNAVPFGVPLSLLVAAATYSPAIMQLFTKSKNEVPKELEKEFEKQGKEDIETFMRDHAWSIPMTEDADLSFPPGHPQVDNAYRLHPLASVRSANKTRVYIPAEQYDAILLQEREAELIRLLVHLGATKISISTKRRISTSSKLTATVGVSVPVANGDVAADKAKSNTADDDRVRTFELAGKQWTQGDTVDRTHFAWAAFEPSWDALIVAREVGGCLKADLEVKEKTTFSSDWGLTATTIAKQVFKGNGSASLGDNGEEESVFFVQASFSQPVRSAQAGVEMRGVLASG